jgi:hypothetical protein
MEYNTLDLLQSNLEINYLNNLIIAANKSNIDTLNINKYLNKLSNKEIENTVTEKISETSDVEYLYLKAWNKLTIIHKIIKIKEFINNLECSSNEKETLINQLIDLIKSKSKLKLIYDENKGNIISLSVLCFTNGKYYIE